MSSPRLTELQLAILCILWDRGETTSARVQEDLAETRPLALTTITTLLSRLEKKGAVSHRRDGRRYLYSAAVDKEDVREGMIDGLSNSLFDGDLCEMVEWVVARGDLLPDQLRHLREALDRVGGRASA